MLRYVGAHIDTAAVAVVAVVVAADAAAAVAAVYTGIAVATTTKATTTTTTAVAMTTLCLTCVATGPSFVAIAADAIRATHCSDNASNFDGDRHFVALTQVNDTY